MCGICGTTTAGDGAAIASMNALMTHRGPDDEGVFIDPSSGVGLGARRLSIIDPKGGHQPLSNETGTVWAVSNGEIYNFPRLRERLLEGGHRFATHTDTEVLVHLYEEKGARLVDELEGMYAFAIWDSTERKLLLVRDRFGEKPLFYREQNGTLSFASEVNALLAGTGNGKELNPEAVDAYFVYGYVPADMCIYAGVSPLEPGHQLLWDETSKSSRVTEYWRPPPYSLRNDRPTSDLVAETGELLDRAVSSRLISDVPLGIFLSGGLDSTLVAAFAAQHTSGRIKTYTVDYDVGSVGEKTSARAVAAALGSDHDELVLTSQAVAETIPGILAGLDQPIADPAFVALRALSDFARRDVKVAVGGEGADELFGGYPRYRWLTRSARVSSGLAAVSARAAQQVGRVRGLERVSRLGDALGPGTTFDRHLGWVTSKRLGLRAELYGPQMREALASSHQTWPTDLGALNGDIASWLMRLDQSHWLPGDVLAKADRASMGASLEMRTPFLSRELSQFAASVPSSIHVRGGGKSLLRGVLNDRFPAVVLDHPKVAFRTPTAEWLRGPLASTVAQQLQANPLYEMGWFAPATVAGWVSRLGEGRLDATGSIWPAFAIGCWAEENL